MTSDAGDGASREQLLDEIAALRRERDARATEEDVWIRDATRFAGDGITDVEARPNERLFESAFFTRQRAVGTITVEETAGATKKGASIVTITRGDDTRFFGAVVDTAGMSVTGAIMSNRIAGLIRGIISTGAITTTDLKRIAALTQETLDSHNVRGRFLTVTAWVLEKSKNRLNVINSGGSGLVVERADGTETRAGESSGPPMGLLPDILGIAALPEVETVDLDGAVAFRTAGDGIENAVLFACSSDECEIDTDDLEDAVRSHAHRRLAFTVPREIAGVAAGKTLHFDQLGEEVSPLVRIQVAAAALSLETPVERDVAHVDADNESPGGFEVEPGSRVDARLAHLIKRVLPEVEFLERGGIARFPDLAFSRAFTPTGMRVSWVK